MVVLIWTPVIMTPMPSGMIMTVTTRRPILIVPVNVFLQWIVQMFVGDLQSWIIAAFVWKEPPVNLHVFKIAIMIGVVLQSLTIVKIAFKEIQISQPAFRIAMVNGVVRL